MTEEKQFLGEKEWLIIHARKVLENEHFDYLIFGHRHIPVDKVLTDPKEGRKGISRYINLGEWINHFSYAVFDGKELELKYYK